MEHRKDFRDSLDLDDSQNHGTSPSVPCGATVEGLAARGHKVDTGAGEEPALVVSAAADAWDAFKKAPRRGLGLAESRQQAISASTGSRPRHLASTERYPKQVRSLGHRPGRHQEKPLVVQGYDATTLYRQELRNELLRCSRHLRPSAQNAIRALAADVTIENRRTVKASYFWSQGRLADRARQTRETMNRNLKLLAENGLVEIPPKRRAYQHPKTLSLPAKLLLKVMQTVIRKVESFVGFKQGHNRERSDRAPRRRPRLVLRHILRAFPGGPRPPNRRRHLGKLPSLEEALGLFQRKWERKDGYRVNCPCHGWYSVSKQALALGEGRIGQLLYHCFNPYCTSERVRAALVEMAA